MKTFEECKDQVAKTYGFRSGWPAQQFWNNLKGNRSAIAYRWASELYARECCQASLNKAAESAQPIKYLCDGEWWVNSNGIDKKSIIDPSNIVLL